jgi:uncharacterized protein
LKESVELTLFLDHACNLRCRYCYGGDKFSRPMSNTVMRRAVDLALAERPALFEVAFFGGEPLLHIDLVQETIAYVEQATLRQGLPPSHVRYVMNTNGTLVDDHILTMLAPPRPFTTYVSLDGPAAIHDAHRVDAAGNGTFSTVTSNLARFRQRQIAFCLVAVVSPENAGQLGAMVRTLLAERPAFIILSPNLHTAWSEESIAALRAGLDDAAAVWMSAFRCGHAVPVEPLHTKILAHLCEGIPCPTRCTLAGGAWAVAPSGRLYTCAQIIGEDENDALAIGTVGNGLDRRRLSELRFQKDRVEEHCAPCALRTRCQSQCGCRHLALTRELGRITAVLCEIEASFIDAADHVASVLHAEGCPTFMDTYYAKRHRPADGASLTRLRRPSAT